MTAPRVDVIPDSVVPVLRALRDAAQACNRASGGLALHTPLMPPVFFAQARERLESMATSLRMLAADLERASFEQWARLASLERAAGEELSVPVDELPRDLRSAAAVAWGQAQGERGLDVLVDPEGPQVHAAMGATDALVSTWNTARVLLLGTPLYPRKAPGGAEARQELVAMGINLTRMSLPWFLVEPEDGATAQVESMARVTDFGDLASGDVYRWGGHIGTSLLMGKVIDALTGGAAVGSTWRQTTRGTYATVNQANKVPAGGRCRPRTPAGRAVIQVEAGVGRFLETVVP